MVESDTPVTLWNLELVLYPEGNVQKFDWSIDVKAIDYTLKVLLKMLGSENHHNTVTLMANESAKYGVKYHKPTSDSYDMTVQSASRTVQARAKYSPSEMGIKVYPNKGRSEIKYEVVGKSSHDYWNRQKKYEGHISHPRLTKDMKVALLVEDSGERRSGSFELDIFPDTQDKITGELQSVWVANNTIKIEAKLKSRVKFADIYIIDIYEILHTERTN